MTTKVLFVGSHLSLKRGTKGISEKISEILKDDIEVILVSKVENRFFRLIDILSKVVISKAKIIHIDVYSKGGFLYADFATKFAKICNKKVILNLRGGMLPELHNAKPTKVFKLLSRADNIITPSMYLKSYFEEQQFKITRIPNFIDLENFPYCKPNTKNNSLLWVRAFSPEYHPELAVLILKEVLKIIPDVTLTMIGPDKGSLELVKNLIKDNDLQRHIKILGPVKNERLFEFFHNHTVYLNTTEYESFGMAVLEAASAGIPIVSSSVGEIPLMWQDKKDILLAKSLNKNNFAEHVKDLLNSKSLREKLSENARKKSILFDKDIIREKWIKVLKVDI